MRPLRVSFVADTESWGGAETWVVHHLRRAGCHDVEASVVCAEQVADRFAPWVPPSALAVVPLARHAVQAPATAAALAGQAPDVVLVNLVDPGSNAASVAAALSVAPTAAMLHLPGDTGEGLQQAALAGLYGDLSVLLTPSEAGAKQVREELAEPRSGIVVTCNGVDIPVRPHGPAGHRPPRIGVHARLTRQKGIDVLLEAVRTMVGEGRRLEVCIGGRGREEAALREAAEGLPVSFVGWVTEPRRFLAGVDVFAQPSRHEALPLALLEAMAEGLPCVATDVGDVRVRLGDAVDLVPPEDPQALAGALTRLLLDGDRRSALGRAARVRAETRLDASAMAAETYGVVRSALRATASR
jgi:glycosyltransferase involved in cell wall biosynthesis